MVTITSPRAIAIRRSQVDSIRERIERITEDLNDIKTFFPIRISTKRTQKLKQYLKRELELLREQPFECYDQQEKVDYLLIKNYLERQLRQVELDIKQDQKTKPLLPFADILVKLCEDRALVVPIEPKDVAQKLYETQGEITTVIAKIKAGSKDLSMEKTSAFRASKTMDSLRDNLKEWYGFYKGYDPSFDWWVSRPYSVVDTNLETASITIRERLVGIDPDNEDAIVGDPIGREGLLNEFRAEMIPYTPEEVIAIGEKEFQWCIKELKKASRAMGLKDNWKEALEQVKNDFVEPGKQTQLVLDLVEEAISFVEEHDLITVPQIAKETWQMFMMSPERQKVNPFFLGGECIIVSYPVDTMDHEAKMMSMRGNNIHFSRATVFHEMIPGHHLQMHMNARHKPYRRLFDTPFWIEGWSLYWEFILWDNERFTKTPQNRIGMLFWRLHRCARIIFSIKFHLGQMAPQECIDLLVDEVGHERTTAEGEVRRSLNGDYSPLYQAGYMLGALQIYALRKEVVDKHYMAEKVFHDRFLKENRMPIELVRALIMDQPLSRDYQTSWKFYSA
ncbi:uncharacterized protein N7443_006487 [Penicillium atrosanguineum]|uniref:uncharacterized protein n=1 Tax=Penicillium atrosanguineum TaxID=1132637 RepID=UPI0023857552|nr:uncharacterized protein N7443_006487 [Penicillium atrosanguineum]KAJ5298367.1 hypothetical protein N7443_006487 [Penicillium atrosanguineum]